MFTKNEAAAAKSRSAPEKQKILDNFTLGGTDSVTECKKPLNETITSEHDLVKQLTPLSETQIFDFMQNLRGGTYFNMGMYGYIPVSRAYKKTLRIYKIVNMTAIVSGVSYENIGTTKDFRNRTGETAGHAWYDHMSGYENKVGVKKSDPNSKYILWDIKDSSSNWVRYYVVDIATGVVTPVSKNDVMTSGYLTESEKAKLTPKKVEGYDKATGVMIENQTNWRTTAFDHIFWLSQSGANTKEYGARFMESKKVTRKTNLKETHGSELFRDAHANIHTDLDAILSGGVEESMENHLAEETYEKPNTGKKYVVSSEPNPAPTDNVFYWFDDEIYSDYVVQTLADFDEHDFETTLGDARFVANTILSMSDLHRLYILDADTLEEVDSLDYYVDYEDEDIYPGYFEESVEKPLTEANNNKALTKMLTETYRRTVSRGKTLNENELFVDFD